MAAKQENAELFAESSQGAVSALTFFGFIVSAVLFFGGMVLMGYGFGVESTEAIFIFVGGLAATFLGTIVAFGILPAIESQR